MSRAVYRVVLSGGRGRGGGERIVRAASPGEAVAGLLVEERERVVSVSEVLGSGADRRESTRLGRLLSFAASAAIGVGFCVVMTWLLGTLVMVAAGVYQPVWAFVAFGVALVTVAACFRAVDWVEGVGAEARVRGWAAEEAGQPAEG